MEKESESVIKINKINLHSSNKNIEEVEVKDFEKEYIKQLSVQEKTAFQIAKNHLGSSFHIRKSNGYNEWLKNKK